MGAVSPLPALAARASVLGAPPLCPQTPSPTTPTAINPHLRAPQLRGCSTPSAEHSWLTPPECLLHCRQQGPAGPAALCAARHWARQGHRSSGEFINTTLQYLVSSADSLERLGAGSWELNVQHACSRGQEVRTDRATTAFSSYSKEPTAHCPLPCSSTGTKGETPGRQSRQGMLYPLKRAPQALRAVLTTGTRLLLLFSARLERRALCLVQLCASSSSLPDINSSAESLIWQPCSQ